MFHLSHAQDGYLYHAVVSGSPEEKTLRGTGSGDSFVPNPYGWRQIGIVGPFTVFMREQRN